MAAIDISGLTKEYGDLRAFVLFLLESLGGTADADSLGALAPMRYYDPTAILVYGRYDLAGAVILLVATGVLLAVSVRWSERKDLT